MASRPTTAALFPDSTDQRHVVVDPSLISACPGVAGVEQQPAWLGVTMYLTRDAVMQTLRFVAGSCARNSEIVFDFSLPDEALSAVKRRLRTKRAERVAKIGEPWISNFDPASLVKGLTEMGFSQANRSGANEANARYFASRTDMFRVRGSACIMTARV